MSGGYQIGPDGVLVRPAEHAASTYTKPELPEEAKENTERGAELAAEHYLALLTYAWNTGDTQPFADMSNPNSNFANSYIGRINSLYSNGWEYGNSSSVTRILRVKPMEANGSDVPEGTILVKFRIASVDGTSCYGTRITTRTGEYESTVSFLMTWVDGRWQETQGKMISDDE